ncbi:YfhO family protein [Rubricoccus marinus]|uniref:Membrane protein 6-pyruvoyl-tetrahydropterin synthase-related domain-containing protein n=1 Tax=Rubricoccus marinus TaxID=716817 RepID=A0A259TW54_9BACT|nr:YfhO family protein [Rubricoccus marinus]OZC01999.1 hypothetical protein BSZ36_02785 [Rubricoccus marinus]
MAKSTRSTPTSKTNKPAPLEGNKEWRKRGRVRHVGPTLGEKTWWENLPAWGRHAISLGFLLIVALGFTAPATFGGKKLAGDDTVRWRATAEALLDWEETGGKRALWTPNVFAGMPAYLIHDTAGPPSVDSIPSALRKVGLWPLAHLVVLLFGAYALVVFLTRTPLAGVIGAVGYGLSTYLPIILVAGHNSKFIALAWAPWLLLAFGALIRRPAGSGWQLAALLTGLFAIAAAVNLRAGHVQITYYVVIIAAIWWVAEGIADVKTGQLKAYGLSTLFLLAGSVLALLMVAHPYLVQWEYKAFTTRSAGPGGGLAWQYAMNWSQGVGETLTLLVSGAYGGASPTYWGPKVFTSGPHYVGPVVLFLAVLGIAGVARRSVFAFTGAGVLTILFALGENFSLLNRPAFELLPLFSSFRVPETWLAATALLLALLSGWGAYYVQRREATPEAETRKRRTALATAGAFAVILGLLAVAGPSLLSLEKEGEGVQIEQMAAQQGLDTQDPAVRQQIGQILSQTRSERAEMLTGDAWRALLLLAFALTLVAARLWGKIPSWAALTGLALLVTIDLWGVGRRYFNEDVDALRRRSDLAVAVPEGDADRFIEERVIEAGGPGTFRVLPPNPSQNAYSSAFYESVGGYHGAKLALIQDYFDRLLPDDSTGLNETAIDLLAARYVVLPGGALPSTTPLFQDPATGLVVAENPDALPRAFLVQDAEVIEDDPAMIARIRSGEVDLRQTALLHEPLPDGFALAGGRMPLAPAADSLLADSLAVDTAMDSLGARPLAPGVSLVRFSPDEIVWTVAADAPSLLVVNEIYYPAGWTATVDSREAPIVRANYLLRGVPLPEGRHVVTMRFRPESHKQGVTIAWIATLLTYLGVIALSGLLWYRRGHGTED